jgi:hypothetical protein
MRYLSRNQVLQADVAETNIMVYGFTPGDSGHGDVRLVIPKRPAEEIAELVEQHGLALPVDGDVAFLEWPTERRATFKLSLLERNSPLNETADQTLATANSKNQLVGQGACWLAPNMSPAW